MRTWNRTALGNEPDQLLIGSPVNRTSGHANLDRIAMETDTFCTGRVGLDMHREDHTPLAVANDGPEGIHKKRSRQKMALTNSRMVRCMSESSVIGRATATSQARSGETPCLISVPA